MDKKKQGKKCIESVTEAVFKRSFRCSYCWIWTRNDRL